MRARNCSITSKPSAARFDEGIKLQIKTGQSTAGCGSDREAQYLVKKILAARFDAGIRLQNHNVTINCGGAAEFKY
jgi:hypothetical protein